MQTVNTWSKRPTGPTGIPNLFVAGDWIRTNANVCCMEGGNEGGRMAARAVVEASGRDPGRIALWDYYMPPQLNWIKDIDRRRLQRGLPNLFEAVAAGHPHTFGEAMQGAVKALTDRTVAA